LPPVESAKKYVEYMGGAKAVIAKAREDFRKGEYRWVAQALNHVVFAEPGNEEARNFEADALEQLGYQAEAATWRNNYLTAAYELRNGVHATHLAGNVDALAAMTIPMIFDLMGVQLNGPKADGKTIVLNWNFTDVGEKYVLTLENSTLTYMPQQQAPNADATLTLARSTLDAINMRKTTVDKEVTDGKIKIEGSGKKVGELFSLFDTFTGDFNIVTP
jgi:alkyl sulfatase BDS1-like metallo-beta-lactamase superfamily hydrolase